MKQKDQLALEVATLKRKNMELEAQLAHVYHFAEQGILQANRDTTFGSGVLVRLSYLGGREVCSPFVIKDGLSNGTIAALRDDLAYSYTKTMEFKPKGV